MLLCGLAAAATALSGCTAAPRAQLVAERPAQAVLSSARKLRDGYDAALDAQSDLADMLTLLRDNHAAHVDLLEKLLDRRGDSAASDEDAESSPDESWRDVEADEFKIARDACVAASPAFVVVLAEIAACRASHVDALEAMSL